MIDGLLYRAIIRYPVGASAPAGFIDFKDLKDLKDFNDFIDFNDLQ